MERKVKLPVSGIEVTLKRLTFGDENNATRKTLQLALIEGKNDIDIVTKREFLLLEGIVDSPWSNLDELRSIDRHDGMVLWKAHSELNEVSSGELTGSEADSSVEEPKEKESGTGA